MMPMVVISLSERMARSSAIISITETMLKITFTITLDLNVEVEPDTTSVLSSKEKMGKRVSGLIFKLDSKNNHQISDNVMKKLILLLFILCSSSVCKAQSPELKAAYNQVVSTLKEYKFKSLEVYDNGADYASTRSITIKMQGGNIIVTFKDNFGAFSDPFFGNKQGTKTIKVSIKDAKIQLGRWNDNKIMFSSENGVEFTYKGKKELLEEYAICGEKLSCKKLLGELTTMLTLAQEEEFNGSLGVVTQNKRTSSKTKQNNAATKKPATTKSAGKYVQ